MKRWKTPEEGEKEQDKSKLEGTLQGWFKWKGACHMVMLKGS